MAATTGIVALMFVAVTLFLQGSAVGTVTEMEAFAMIGGGTAFVVGSITAMTLLHR
ncbi:hypothetical protein [Marisediminicola senii]|uniref:hypothetical protein n=1 Tax=Marisediminicola senii TaxID=2711233 RepID=UPI0013EA664A|nr:hypothetical protein [Marisediminicola senii]